MKPEDIEKLRIERYLKHREQASQHVFYAIQRMDLLIISISGAGIYVIFETLRFLKESHSLINTFPLKFVGGCFVIAIIANFFSQRTGKIANINEEEWADLEIKNLMGAQIDEDEKKTFDDKSTKYTKWTAGLNTGSMWFMIGGITLLLLFNLIHF